MTEQSVTKKLTEIKRSEWIAYRWHEITQFSDPEPVFLRGILRNPDDAINASVNFDALWKAVIDCKRIAEADGKPKGS